MARRRTIAAAILLIAFVGVASADLSMTDHLRGWMDAAVSQIGWGSGAASGAQAITHGRSLVEDSSSRAMNINFTPIPAWRGRFDLQYGLSYFAPALVINNCNRNTQSCSNIPGLSYPYYQFLVDPTAPETGKPVMQVWYPAGSWSPTAPTPGGALFYAYPYKNNPSEAADPLSMYGATMEYEVFFPTGFDFVKGKKKLLELNWVVFGFCFFKSLLAPTTTLHIHLFTFNRLFLSHLIIALNKQALDINILHSSFLSIRWKASWFRRW